MMAQHTTTQRFGINPTAARQPRWTITPGMVAHWKMRALRVLALPLVYTLLANECLRAALSSLHPQATMQRYRAGRLALGFYGESRYLVFWTGRRAYVRPVGRYGVLNKAFAGQAHSMFEALLVAQTYLGEQQW